MEIDNLVKTDILSTHNEQLKEGIEQTYLVELLELFPIPTNFKQQILLQFQHINLKDVSLATLVDLVFEKVKVKVQDKPQHMILLQTVQEKFDLVFATFPLLSLKLTEDTFKSFKEKFTVQDLLKLKDTYQVDKLLKDFIKLLVFKLESLSLPSVENTYTNCKIKLDDIVLNCLNLQPDQIKVKVLERDDDSEYELIEDTKLIQLEIFDILAEASNVKFEFNRFITPKFQERGLMDVTIGPKGLDLKLVIRVTTDPNLIIDQFNNFNEREPPNFKPGTFIVDNLFEISTTESKPEVAVLQIENELEPTSIDPFSTIDSSSESEPLLDSTTTNSKELDINSVVEVGCETWDGDLADQSTFYDQPKDITQIIKEVPCKPNVIQPIELYSLVPSLPSETIFRTVDKTINNNNLPTTSTTPLLESSEEEKEVNSSIATPSDSDPNNKLQLAKVFKVVKVEPKVKDFKILLKQTKHDWLYRWLNPIITKFLKNKLELAVRTVILGSCHSWLLQYLTQIKG